MAKPRVNTRRQFNDAHAELRKLMQYYLRDIGAAMVKQIVNNVRALPNSQRMNAVKNVKQTGSQEFRRAILAALGAIAAEALENARKEVPKAKRVKLAEIEPDLSLGDFNSLPAAIQAKIRGQYELLTDTQLNDIIKAVNFQFNSSIDSTDSMDTLTADLQSAVDSYVDGTAVNAGAGAISSQVINETRNEFFDDPEVQDQIDAFEFVNEDPVSPICTDLAGTIFEVDDPDRFKYTPPLHFNCKSYIAPILKGRLGDRETESLKSVPTKRGEASIQFAEEVGCGCGGHLIVSRE